MFRNGIDLVEVDRIRKSCENPAFLSRVFGARERAEFSAYKQPYTHIAGAFAAKEAFSKALGTGLRGFSLCEVEVLHDNFGAPYLSLSGTAAALAKEKNLAFALSITHTDSIAAAVVTAYPKGDAETL